MKRKKVLLVSHNHPAIRPGGAEGYAFELYESMRESATIQPIFLARTGPPVSAEATTRDGTAFSAVNSDRNQYFFHTDVSDYDWFFGRSPRKDALAVQFRNFLLAHRPDVVHFQHTFFIGYDVLTVTRDTLPDVPIVYTLHEYLPICHRTGQLLRTVNEELCTDSSPRRCHECFPDVSPQRFFMRKRFIQRQFELVDLFLAASPYAVERFIDWGIPRERIRMEPYGKRPVARLAEKHGGKLRNRFGFFGQLSPFKGVNLLLQAVDLLGDTFGGQVELHGANLDFQTEEFQRDFQQLLTRTGRHVKFAGRYEPEDIPHLMSRLDWVLVPSLWWETGPLVVYEAFQHGRPVICSDIGGMSERVTDGVNGLHFRRGDARDLATVLRRAASEPELWTMLSRGVPEVYSMDRHLAAVDRMYDGLIRLRSGANSPRTASASPLPAGFQEEITTAHPNE